MFGRKLKRLFYSMAILVPLSALAYYAAFLLRFGGELSNATINLFFATVGWVLAIKAAVIVQSRLHLECSRYVTFRDMLVLARAVTLASVGITLTDAMLITYATIPRSVLLLDWGGSLLLLAAVRTVPRLVRNGDWRVLTIEQGTTALIVGANDAGEALLRTIRRSPSLAYRPVGFIDEQPHVLGRRIAGVPVLGSHADIAQLAKEYAVEEVLILDGLLPGKKVRELVNMACQHDFRVKVLPSYEQLLQERVAVNPRPVAIADLLHRSSVDLDISEIRHWVEGRVLLVTGSAGSIGSEICRQLVKLAPRKILLMDRSETGQFFLERELRRLAPHANLEVVLADLTDLPRLQAVFQQQKPDIIFHAAAYKHVPLMELHAGEAVKNIVLSTRHLVDLAEEHQAEGFVMISTDKAVNPTSVMGSCKRLAEQYIEAKASTSSCRLVTVRFGNVLDSAGSVVPIFREQIARGGPITVTHPEMVRYFMLIPEAAQLVIQAGAMGKGGEIFVLDMGDPVRIMDLAKDMIRLSGLRVGDDIEIEVTGLRAGEKLYEELYGDCEQNKPTCHPKIMVAAGEPRSLLEVLHDIGQLISVLEEPNKVVRATLQQIIPIQASSRAEPAAQKRTAA